MAEHDDLITNAFTDQAAGYDASPTTNAAAVLDLIAELAAPTREGRWLDAACGTGIVSRRLAPLAGTVVGIDLTPAMLELAAAQAARAQLDNLTYSLTDATATGLDTDAFDGAVTRFSVHHIPVPSRLLDELARVVRPGGRIVIVDHVADEDGEARAFTQEIERLRDPAHWSSLTPGELRALGERAGLILTHERLHAFPIDFEEWLGRGTSDPDAHRLVERRLRERPGGSEQFTIDSNPSGGRTLTLQVWMGVWAVPGRG